MLRSHFAIAGLFPLFDVHKGVNGEAMGEEGRLLSEVH